MVGSHQWLQKLVFAAFLLDVRQLKGECEASTVCGKQVAALRKNEAFFHSPDYWFKPGMAIASHQKSHTFYENYCMETRKNIHIHYRITTMTKKFDIFAVIPFFCHLFLLLRLFWAEI